MLSNADAFLDAFFNIQADEHVKAWRWQCYASGEFHYICGSIVYGRNC